MSEPARRAGRVGWRALLAVLLGGLTVLGLAPEAGAVETYPVPPTGGYLVDGRGWGHGRGMSQWGAQGAALAGLGYRAILGFYYPGATVTTQTPRVVRVRITAEDDDLQVQTVTGLTVVDPATQAQLPVSGQRMRAVYAGPGTVLVQTLDGTRWTDVPNGRISGPVEFSGSDALWTYQPGGERAYRGALVAVPGSTGLVVVNRVALEDYLYGVVPREVVSSWHAEALRSQAVAARSYASFPCQATPSYDLLDTTSCQVYGGYATRVGSTVTALETSATNAAVQATVGQVVSLGGVVQRTEFSATNGGWTVASGPWPAQADPYDAVAGNTKNRWTGTVVRADRLEAAYPGIGRLVSLVVLSRDGHGEWGGRVLTARLVGTLASKDLTGDQLRTAASLDSTWIHPSGYQTVALAGVDTGATTTISTFAASPGGVVSGVTTATALGATSSDWVFLLTRQADLVGVLPRGGASGRVEVHTLTAASGYTSFSVHAATPLPALPVDTDVQFAVASFAGDGRPNLWVILGSGTGSQRTEVHALSAASGYQQWIVHAATALGSFPPGSMRYLVGDGAGRGDLVAVWHGAGTGSGGSEAHVLSAASGWSAFTRHAALPIGPTDDRDWVWGLGAIDADDQADLVVVGRGPTGSGKVEVHAISGAGSLTTWLMHAATDQPAPSDSQFLVRPLR